MTKEKETEIIESCKEQLKGISVHEVQVEKNNRQILRGIRVGQNGGALGIAVYWNSLVRELGEDCAVDDAVNYIREQAEQYLSQSFSYASVLDWQMSMRKIHKKLVNYERNVERLEKNGIVYRRYLDLAEVGYLKIRVPAGIGTAEITDDLLKRWRVTKEEVFVQAERNIDQEGYQMLDINEMLGSWRHLFMVPMYVLSNSSRNYGAAILADPKLLKCVLRARDADYYILPSSIHELILHPTGSNVSKEALKEMVMEVNGSDAVLESDILSDNVYFYCASTGEIKML